MKNSFCFSQMSFELLVTSRMIFKQSNKPRKNVPINSVGDVLDGVSDVARNIAEGVGDVAKQGKNMLKNAIKNVPWSEMNEVKDREVDSSNRADAQIRENNASNDVESNDQFYDEIEALHGEDIASEAYRLNISEEELDEFLEKEYEYDSDRNGNQNHNDEWKEPDKEYDGEYWDSIDLQPGEY